MNTEEKYTRIGIGMLVIGAFLILRPGSSLIQFLSPAFWARFAADVATLSPAGFWLLILFIGSIVLELLLYLFWIILGIYVWRHPHPNRYVRSAAILFVAIMVVSFLVNMLFGQSLVVITDLFLLFIVGYFAFFGPLRKTLAECKRAKAH